MKEMYKEIMDIERSQIDEQHFDTVIVPAKKWLNYRWKDIVSQWDLIRLLVRRDLLVSYKQSVLGPLWILIMPVLSSLVYTLVFGNFAGLSTDGVPKLLFYLSGQVVWTAFSVTVTGCSHTLTSNRQLFSKVYFPRIIASISSGLSTLIQTLIRFTIIVVLYVYYFAIGEIGGVSWSILLVPALLLHALVLGWGVGILLASITVKYRDLANSISFLMQLWMYATPVVYTLNQADSSRFGFILRFNPMTAIINNIRWAILGSGELLTWVWTTSLFITILIAAFGLFMFGRAEQNAVDML